MTFTLELNAESIRKPTRVDQFEIEAAMLFPEDEALRHVSVRASLTEYAIDHLPELSGEPELLNHVRDHLKSGAPRIRDIQAQVTDRIWHGYIVGAITLRAYFGAEFFGLKSLTALQEEISRSIKPDFQIEPRTMNNKTGPLYKFRPVAHLWAAHSHQAVSGKKAFPCTVSDIPGFLAGAEVIREGAEKTRLPRSNATIMRRGEAVMLPKEVKALLPRVNFVRPTSPESSH